MVEKCKKCIEGGQPDSPLSTGHDSTVLTLCARIPPPSLHLITFDITMLMMTMTQSMRSHLAMRMMMTLFLISDLMMTPFLMRTTRMRVMSRRNIQEVGGAGETVSIFSINL